MTVSIIPSAGCGVSVRRTAEPSERSSDTEQCLDKETTLKNADRIRASYMNEALAIENYIEVLKPLLSSHLEHSELVRLEQRIELLRIERRELLYTAARLSALSSPPPPNPSLAAREREKRKRL